MLPHFPGSSSTSCPGFQPRPSLLCSPPQAVASQEKASRSEGEAHQQDTAKGGSRSCSFFKTHQSCRSSGDFPFLSARCLLARTVLSLLWRLQDDLLFQCGSPGKLLGMDLCGDGVVSLENEKPEYRTAPRTEEKQYVRNARRSESALPFAAFVNEERRLCELLDSRRSPQEDVQAASVEGWGGAHCGGEKTPRLQRRESWGVRTDERADETPDVLGERRRSESRGKQEETPGTKTRAEAEEEPRLKETKIDLRSLEGRLVEETGGEEEKGQHLHGSGTRRSFERLLRRLYDEVVVTGLIFPGLLAEVQAANQHTSVLSPRLMPTGEEESTGESSTQREGVSSSCRADTRAHGDEEEEEEECSGLLVDPYTCRACFDPNRRDCQGASACLPPPPPDKRHILQRALAVEVFRQLQRRSATRAARTGCPQEVRGPRTGGGGRRIEKRRESLTRCRPGTRSCSLSHVTRYQEAWDTTEWSKTRSRPQEARRGSTGEVGGLEEDEGRAKEEDHLRQGWGVYPWARGRGALGWMGRRGGPLRGKTREKLRTIREGHFSGEMKRTETSRGIAIPLPHIEGPLFGVYTYNFELTALEEDNVRMSANRDKNTREIPKQRRLQRKRGYCSPLSLGDFLIPLSPRLPPSSSSSSLPLRDSKTCREPSVALEVQESLPCQSSSFSLYDTTRGLRRGSILSLQGEGVETRLSFGAAFQVPCRTLWVEEVTMFSCDDDEDEEQEEDGRRKEEGASGGKENSAMTTEKGRTTRRKGWTTRRERWSFVGRIKKTGKENLVFEAGGVGQLVAVDVHVSPVSVWH